ncbi:MAG: DUF885 domain-containing protein [Gemmataceae bacterium]
MAAPNPQDAAFQAKFAAFLQAEYARHPYWATRQGNHDFDDRLDDLRPAARAEDIITAKKLLAELRAEFDPAKLSPAVRIDWEIWTHTLNYQLWQAENEPIYETDPRVFGEYISDSVFLLLTQSTLPRERNVANAAKRITYIPTVIDAAKLSLKTPPKILTEVAIQRNQGAIAFYEKEIFALAQENPGTSELVAPAKAAVTALKDYQKFLTETLLPRSTGSWRLGTEKFAKKLELELDSGFTAAEVIREAEAEGERVEREMYYVAKQLWHTVQPGVALPPDDAPGRRETIAKVLAKLGEDHGTSASFVADARASVVSIQKFIREKRILTLPDPDRCQIIEMPEFQRGFSAAYLSPAPPLDAKSNSLYAVAPPPESWPASRQKAFFQEYNKAMLQILTIHEAYPGHYVQLEYGNRHPSAIRKIFYSGTFAEGWAVYTEQMMLDQGYAAGDLSLRLHQLKFYIRAVLNAILDHRMHCTEYSDEEARKLLMDRGFQTEGEALGKIQRAKQSSTQLSTYFVGRMAFYKLRQSVQRSRGAAFDLGKYHEEVLSHGTLPVKYLPLLVK